MPLPDTIVVFALMPVPVRRAPTGSVADVLNVSAVPEILAVTVLVGGTAVISNGCWLETTYDVLLPDWMTLPAPMPVPVRTSPAASVAGESNECSEASSSNTSSGRKRCRCAQCE